MVTETTPSILTHQCRQCGGWFSRMDVSSGVCILCATKRQACAQCLRILESVTMWHIPAARSSSDLWQGRPECWLCVACFNGEAPPKPYTNGVRKARQ